jgi:hypothetical protein
MENPIVINFGHPLKNVEHPGRPTRTIHTIIDEMNFSRVVLYFNVGQPRELTVLPNYGLKFPR